jgi:hypothetical protein
MRPFIDPKLPGWTFSVEEVSMGVYRVDGKHDDGRSVSRVGTEAYDLWDEVIEDAKGLPLRRNS